MTDSVFEIRTENSGKAFIKFNRFHLFRKNWPIAYSPIVVFIALGLFAYADGDHGAGITFWILACCMPLIMLGFTRLAAKMHLRTNKMFANMKNVYYHFDRSGLFNETISPKLTTTLRTDWDNIYRIYETKDSFYVYISNRQAFIIPKVDITAGTADGLALFMMEMAGEKYYKR